jgi:hypothetical protein
MANTEVPYLSNANFWKRLVLSCIALAILYFWHSGMMLHHVYDSPFQYKGADISYWILHWLCLPNIILYNEITAWIFDLGLVFFLVMSIALIEKRGFTILAGILLLLYQLLFNYKIGYHTHHLFGFHFALLPFYFKRDIFKLTVRFAGILCCLSYTFAGISKLYHKAWLVYHSFSDILQSQHAAYLYLHPESLRSQFCLWMIQHPGCGYLFFVLAMLLQTSFVIGICTTRWNRLLALWIVLFHVMDWWLMNLGVFMGMTVMAWLFLYRPVAAGDNNL